MPLTNDVNRWEYEGDGVTPDFAYENLIFAASDLETYFDEVLQVSGLAVSGVGVETGGKVTPTPVVPALVKVVIVRAVPFTQPQDFVNNEAVDAEAFEDGLNRMTILAQQIRDTIGRQVTLPTAEAAGANMEVPAVATRLGQYWGWDAVLGSLVALAPPAGTTAVSVFMAGVITAADAAAARALLDAATDGYKVVESSPPAMTVDVSTGAFFNSVTKARVTNIVQTTGIITAPSVNPRNDIVYVDRRDGVVGIETGTEAVSPLDPVLTINKVPLARLPLLTSTTQIPDALIVDIREVNLLGAGGWAAKDPAVLAKVFGDSPYSVVAADDGKVIDCNATGGAITINLPAAAIAGNGFWITVKKTDASANAVTVDGDGAETIDGAATRVLAARYASETYRCDGSEWHLEAIASGGKIVQVVNTQTGTMATGSTTIPDDNTEPQNDEGDEFMTRAVTPKATGNQLKIEVQAWGSHATSSTRIGMALFQDSTVNALAAVIGDQVNSANGTWSLSLTHYMAAGTTSETTFKVRIGSMAGSGTLTFSGIAGIARFNSIPGCSITITEISA